jgi:hypothetical protein
VSGKAQVRRLRMKPVATPRAVTTRLPRQAMPVSRRMVQNSKAEAMKLF